MEYIYQHPRPPLRIQRNIYDNARRVVAYRNHRSLRPVTLASSIRMLLRRASFFFPVSRYMAERYISESVNSSNTYKALEGFLGFGDLVNGVWTMDTEQRDFSYFDAVNSNIRFSDLNSKGALKKRDMYYAKQAKIYTEPLRLAIKELKEAAKNARTINPR